MSLKLVGWIVLSLAVAGSGLWFVTNGLPDRSATQSQEASLRSDQVRDEAAQRGDDRTGARSSSEPAVVWSFNGTQWQASATPPECPSPLTFASPVDLTKIESILYPGQTRGGNYKPHGGFRFGEVKTNDVSVRAPIDGFIVSGARYIAEGSLQYTFDIIHPCGLMYRVGHLLELTSEFRAIAETFPEAKENDSRTTFVNPPVSVSEGTEIATAVGTEQGPNVFMDWGVYDLRSKNAASQDPAWLAQHTDDSMLAPYAVCWFDLLSADDAARVRSFPAADPTSGKTSDYCK